MKRFQRARVLECSTPRRVADREGRTLEDWVRLARRSPGAVPANVQQVIQRRYPEIAQEVGYA